MLCVCFPPVSKIEVCTDCIRLTEGGGGVYMLGCYGKSFPSSAARRQSAASAATGD